MTLSLRRGAIESSVRARCLAGLIGESRYARTPAVYCWRFQLPVINCFWRLRSTSGRCARLSRSAIRSAGQALRMRSSPPHWTAPNDGTNRAAEFLPVIEETAAFARFQRLASLETSARLSALLEAAAAGALPHFVDETLLTWARRWGSRSYPLAELPPISEFRGTNYRISRRR